MATIGRALQQVKNQLDQWVPGDQIERVCRELGHRWRRRLLDPATTVHLMLLQPLARVALSGLRHVTKLGVSGEAVRKAKGRLPLAALYALVRCVCPPGPTLSVWHDLSVFIADGMGFLTEDTPPLGRKYGKARNGRGAGRCRPTPKLLAVLDLAGGFVHRVIALPWSRQERTCLSRLFAACGESSLLLGDRGLAGFAQVALMLASGVQGCLRLPRWLVVRGRGKAHHRLVRRLGKQDLLVAWAKGPARVGWMSKLRWDRLPERLTLRQVAFRIVRPGFRTHWAWVVTTLTDPREYPAAELAELYGKRWQVEVYFRDLKQTLGLRQLTSKGVAAARKELLALVILYNLVRRVMATAAGRQGVSPDRIGFTDALLWLLWSDPGEELPDLVVNPRRARPTQPRMLKHARRRYPRLNRDRGALTKPACEAKL